MPVSASSSPSAKAPFGFGRRFTLPKPFAKPPASPRAAFCWVHFMRRPRAFPVLHAIWTFPRVGPDLGRGLQGRAKRGRPRASSGPTSGPAPKSKSPRRRNRPHFLGPTTIRARLGFPIGTCPASTTAMKSSFARRLLLSTLLLGSIDLLQAHPGHDDGHELTWDFSHLAAHPVATTLCFTVAATAVWVGLRLIRRRARQRRPR